MSKGVCRGLTMTAAGMGPGRLETEGEMTRHSRRQTMAKLTAATMLQTEATHQHVVLAWGQTLFTEVGRVWGHLQALST
jgi:hypothetical protein